MTVSTDGITELLQAWNRGDDQALEKLTDLVYKELYRSAKRCLSRGRRGDTLQTTALINELYVKMVDLRRVNWQKRAHLFGSLARQMGRRQTCLVCSGRD